MNNKTMNVNNNSTMEKEGHKRSGDWAQEIEMMEMKTTVAPQASPLFVHQFARQVPLQQRSQATTDLHSSSTSLSSKSTNPGSSNITSKSPCVDLAYSSSSSLPSKTTSPSNATSKIPSTAQYSAGSLTDGKSIGVREEQDVKSVHATSMEILTAANADEDDLDLSSLRDLMDTMRQAAKEIRDMTKPVVKTKKKEHAARPRDQKRHHKKRNGRRRSSGHCQQIQAEVHVISEVTGHDVTSLTSSDTSSQLSGLEGTEKQRPPPVVLTPPASESCDILLTSSDMSQTSVEERTEKQLHRAIGVCLSGVPGHAVPLTSGTSHSIQEHMIAGQCHPLAIIPHEASSPTSPSASPPTSPPASPPTAYLHVENEELSHTWPRRRGRSVSRQRSLNDNVPKPASSSEGNSPMVLPPEYDLWVQPLRSNSGTAKVHQGHSGDPVECDTSQSNVVTSIGVVRQLRTGRKGHAHRTKRQTPASPTFLPAPQSVSIPLPNIMVSEHDAVYHQPPQHGEEQQQSPVDEEIKIDIV